MLFRVAVFHYFYSFDKKLPVKVYIFRKAAAAALQKMSTFTGDILIIWGMKMSAANDEHLWSCFWIFEFRIQKSAEADLEHVLS